jgi:hypothetical protein
VVMQHLRQRKEMEKEMDMAPVEMTPLGTVVIHPPLTMSQLTTQGSVLFPLSLNREEMESALSKSNASKMASASSKCTTSMTASPSARFMASAASKSNSLTTASASSKSNASMTTIASSKINSSMMASASSKSTTSTTTSSSSAIPSSIRKQLSSKSRCKPKQMQDFEKEKKQVFMVNNEAYAWALREASENRRDATTSHVSVEDWARRAA